MQKKIGIFIGIIVVLGVGFVTIFSGKKDSTSAVVPVADNSTATQLPPADNVKRTSSGYKDGTYSATGSYMSPGGYDQLGVSLTLKDGIITDVSVTNMAGDEKSKKIQDMFIANYKQYVVGRNISDLNLTKVSGSSLTPQGFNDAIEQIKTQAQA
ncbi:MAG: hypothetical protein V4439_02465 [Patescibacteria group bacterium]